MTSQTYDVIVIGAGPGGYVSALRASQLGMKVAIIEAADLGGVCLNWGCIPTKSLLRSAEVFHLMKAHKEFGLNAEKISANLSEIVARSRKVSQTLASGVTALLHKAKVKVFKGRASFVSSNKVKITGEDALEISASKIVIATGAKARILQGFEPDGVNILTYKEAMMQKEMPESIIVVGSGAIGIEFASFYNSLGVDVTVLEAREHILPQEDLEVSEFARKSFEKQGIKIVTSVLLKSIKNNKKNVTLEFEVNNQKHNLTAEKLIMAVGIVPNTRDIGLEHTKVRLDDKGFVQVDRALKTLDENIYAIGDIVEGPWLAHKASHEGIIVAENIAGKKTTPIDKNKIPACTYSMPQIASIGLTELEAKNSGKKIRVGKFPFMGNGKAIALGESEGFIKMIFEETTGEILGSHMIGAEVTELINSIALAMTLEATEEDIIHTIFPHPTLSEMIHESALSAFNRAIHIPNK
ncbi:MAG: dihydrolipoyl dehydrogenase [Rickettsiaceae bacterium]|nr:dihydrolipoyl dehydrogenase [Rickettsiaceae bacterium]